MRLCVFSRLIVAAGAVLLGSPALVQAADLGVTLTIPDDATVDTRGCTLGGTKTFVATITNPSTTVVTEFTLNATLDAPFEVASVSGCAPVGEEAFPCKVSPSGFQAGDAPASTQVRFDVRYPAPDPMPTTCPDTATLYGVTVAVSDGKSGSAALLDPVAANDTARASTYVRPFADLSVESVQATGTTSEGGSVQYVVQVMNNGPCAATNVRATLSPPRSLTFADVSAECTNGAAGFRAKNRCELGTMAAGASTSFTAAYTVGSFPADTASAGVPTKVAIASVSPGEDVAAVDDVVGDNNSKTRVTHVDVSNSGCSTGGAGSLAALLPLVALRLARRRRSS